MEWVTDQGIEDITEEEMADNRHLNRMEMISNMMYSQSRRQRHAPQSSDETTNLVRESCSSIFSMSNCQRKRFSDVSRDTDYTTLHICIAAHVDTMRHSMVSTSFDLSLNTSLTIVCIVFQIGPVSVGSICKRHKNCHNSFVSPLNPRCTASLFHVYNASYFLIHPLVSTN